MLYLTHIMCKRIIFTLCLIFSFSILSLADEDEGACSINATTESCSESSSLSILNADYIIAAKEYRKLLIVSGGDIHVYGKVGTIVILDGNVVFHPESEIEKTVVILGGSFEQKDGVKLPDEGLKGFIKYSLKDSFFTSPIIVIVSIFHQYSKKGFDLSNIYFKVIFYLIHIFFLMLAYFLFPNLMLKSKNYLCERPVFCSFLTFAMFMFIPFAFLITFIIAVWILAQTSSTGLFIAYLIFSGSVGFLAIFLLAPLSAVIIAKLLGDTALKWTKKDPVRLSFLSICVGMIIFLALSEFWGFRIILGFLQLVAISAFCVQLYLALKDRFTKKFSAKA